KKLEEPKPGERESHGPAYRQDDLRKVVHRCRASCSTRTASRSSALISESTLAIFSSIARCPISKPSRFHITMPSLHRDAYRKGILISVIGSPSSSCAP